MCVISAPQLRWASCWGTSSVRCRGRLGVGARRRARGSQGRACPGPPGWSCGGGGLGVTWVFMTWGALTARTGLCDPNSRRGAGPRDPQRGAGHSRVLLAADTMSRALLLRPRAGHRGASDCGPCPGPRTRVPDHGPWDPAPSTPPARHHPRIRPRSRSRSRPQTPARPRSPTPRASRRAAAPGSRRPRPWAAQWAARLRPVAPGNCRTRGSATRGRGTRPGRGAQAVEGSKGEVLEAGMEPGERKRLPSAAASEGEQREHKLKRGIPQDLLSSPKLDKYKIARQLTDKAVKEKKIFSIYGHYPVIRAALRRKGWVEKKFYFLPKPVAKVEGDGEGVAENRCSEGKENQEEALENTDDIHDVMSRLVKNEMPYFLWTLKRDIVDYHSLSCDQMLNHYGKTAAFTTKIGLCMNMRTLPWYVQADPDSFFPRCYGLCTESDKQEFLDDFRRTVASSILKWVVSQQNGSKSKRKSSKGEAGDSDPSSKQVPENTRSRLMGLSGQLVDAACKVCEAYLGRLEHKDIDLSEDAAEDLTEDEWKDLTQQYYSLVRGNAFISSSRSRFSQCQALLNKITSVNPQTEIDGLRNIWIIKPAAKSRGRDIVCMNHVEEILELVAADHLPAKDKWVVQKYIETPLLIYDTKFDIRQWFLVTDWNPLTIWFYKESYLRFSTRRFSLDNLDSAIHLCNNSIQKHLKNDKGRSPLLPCHNTWTSTRFQEYLQKRGRGAVWSSIIYPSMKRAIANTMRVAQGRVEPRKNSFELYGADFILGRDFKPWLIEINSSPTMHASTPVTAQLCAQVQEDTIKVVVDRRVDRNCDTGNFELLWRQPAVELPPFQGSDLFVEGVGTRKAKRQMPPISTFDSASSLSNIQPLKERCPSALPGLAPAPPRTALQPDLRMKDEKVLACTLPLPLNRPAGRSAKVSCDLSEPGSGMELPTCHLQHLDHTAPNTGLTRVESDKRWDPNLLKVHPLRSVLPSMKTVEGAQCPPPRPSEAQDSPCGTGSRPWPSCVI
ncbi:protein monoglycylase TTLL8 isoform X2 [Camelus bactrianus]|uniref:Protein monoglycylase TTLL8 isoform X2 n=1 Tax=Camelus bactrianus TaxID=9837 RepID=A0AC58RBJ2_CAMBA